MLQHDRRAVCTVNQAAARLGVTTRQIRRLIQSGRLASIKLGHVRLLHTAEVDTYKRERIWNPGDRRSPEARATGYTAAVDLAQLAHEAQRGT